MKSFTERVLHIVKNIPQGTVLSYGDVARRAGNAKASRAVGTIMAHNTDKQVPCHRVIRSDGHIGVYNGLQGKSKAVLLKREGVKFTSLGKVERVSKI